MKIAADCHRSDSLSVDFFESKEATQNRSALAGQGQQERVFLSWNPIWKMLHFEGDARAT
jgi:hypothetical protein